MESGAELPRRMRELIANVWETFTELPPEKKVGFLVMFLGSIILLCALTAIGIVAVQSIMALWHMGWLDMFQSS